MKELLFLLFGQLLETFGLPFNSNIWSHRLQCRAQVTLHLSRTWLLECVEASDGSTGPTQSSQSKVIRLKHDDINF